MATRSLARSTTAPDRGTERATEARSRKRAAPTRRAPLTASSPALLRAGSDDDFRGMVHDLLAFSHHLEACRDGFATLMGITGVQYELLQAVRRFGEQADPAGGPESRAGISVGQAAARLHRSGAFITMEAGKLVERGLMRKQDDPADARRVLLTLTQDGEGLIERVAPHQQKVNDVLFECLDEARFRQLRELARELVGCGDRAANLIDFLVRDATARAA